MQKKIKKLKERARKISIKEGCWTSAQGSFGDSYITPYAIALNSPNTEIAFLSSFPGLLGPISQWFGSNLIEKYSRKKIVLLFVLIQALTWLPIIVLALLFWKGVLANYIPLMLIIFFSLYIIFGNFASPAWFSWMGDIVDEKERGRYFSRREKILGIISVMLSLIAAFFLDFFKKHGIVLVGFSIFFFLAMTARLVSRKFFKREYEPKIKLKKGYYFSFWQFLKKAPLNNFGKFTIFRALISFAVFIASPFFAVYMLRNLNFGYLTFMIVTLSQTVFSLAIMPIWGKFSDRFGNYEVIRITSALIPAIPILWLFSRSPYYLIFCPMMISGIAWAGFNLAIGNFIYDSVTPQRRGLCVSYFNIFNGIGVFIGATIGGILIKYLTVSFMSTILFIFLISGIARAIVNMIMLPKIKEIREAEKFDSKRALKNLVLKTIKIPLIGPQHELMVIKKLKWKA